MRAWSRIILTGLILVTLLWLKLQFDKLWQSILELDRLSEQSGGYLSNSGYAKSASNVSGSEVEDPLGAVFHAISNGLVADTIEDLATPKSALRDRRTKTVVVAKVMGENTNWIPVLLPNWEHAVYVVDNHNAPFHTARNKGREANAYLTYIVDNYSDLPDTVAFIHSHINSWHNEQNAARALQLLNIDSLQENGYANFRCHHDPGCSPAEIQPFREHKQDDGHKRETEVAFAAAWKELFKNTEVPTEIGVACCAQFAVSKQQIQARPREEYVGFHSWLMNTTLNDDVSGRIFEYIWHIIFGKDPVYCPTVRQCYQDVYDQYIIG